jgi:hypothetical protein
VLVIILAGEGMIYPIIMLSVYNPEERTPFSAQMIRPYLSGEYPVDPDDAQAVSFLRTHMGPSEMAFRAAAKFEPYAVWGGLATTQPWDMYASDSRDNDMYGLGGTKFAIRKNLAMISEDWLDRLAAENVTWVVTDAQDGAANAVLDSLQGRQSVVLAAKYGNIRVFHFR